MPEQGGPPAQIDTAADLAKARLDIAKAMEIEQTMLAPPPSEPGLFEVNMGKAQEHQAKAQAAAASAGLNEAKTMESLTKAAKTGREARTIDESPMGMLTTPPPPRPTGER